MMKLQHYGVAVVPTGCTSSIGLDSVYPRLYLSSSCDPARLFLTSLSLYVGPIPVSVILTLFFCPHNMVGKTGLEPARPLGAGFQNQKASIYLPTFRLGRNVGVGPTFSDSQSEVLTTRPKSPLLCYCWRITNESNALMPSSDIAAVFKTGGNHFPL